MATPVQRRRYKNPPLIEAVLEFQFLGGAEWAAVFLGKIHTQLPDFPEIEVLTGTSFVISPVQVGLRSVPEINRFWRTDRGMAITVGPELLGVSALPPAMPEGQRWELLRDTAFHALEVYQSIAKPGTIRQVGLRYINALSVDPASFRLGDYVIQESGMVPDILLDERNPFSLRSERTTAFTERYQRREIVTLEAQPDTTQPGSPPRGRILLDIDQLTVWRAESGTELAEVRDVCEDMHDAVHGVFNRVIKPEVLQRFGPENFNPE
jgi:uncharacterized protein (TIGR04255 family)